MTTKALKEWKTEQRRAGTILEIGRIETIFVAAIIHRDSYEHAACEKTLWKSLCNLSAPVGPLSHGPLDKSEHVTT